MYYIGIRIDGVSSVVIGGNTGIGDGDCFCCDNHTLGIESAEE